MDGRLEELLQEFERGRIYEATIVADDAHLEGQTDPRLQTITIDPKVSIVATLLHELLHRRYPLWSERRVKQEEQRLMGILTLRDVQTWYRRYKRAVRKRRPVDGNDYPES